MNDLYLYIIVAMLPLSSLMLMLEVNPYNALVIRGIVGAVAVLVYVVLGAADVALTEALMGTMLAVCLYIIAVRSSFVLRIGILNDLDTENDRDFTFLTTQIKQVIKQYYLRLELIHFETQAELEQALTDKEIHGICHENPNYQSIDRKHDKYEVNIRVKKINQLVQERISKKLEKTLTY